MLPSWKELPRLILLLSGLMLLFQLEASLPELWEKVFLHLAPGQISNWLIRLDYECGCSPSLPQDFRDIVGGSPEV